MQVREYDISNEGCSRRFSLSLIHRLHDSVLEKVAQCIRIQAACYKEVKKVNNLA